MSKTIIAIGKTFQFSFQVLNFNTDQHKSNEKTAARMSHKFPHNNKSLTINIS